MLDEKNKDSDYSVTLVTLHKNSLFHNNLWEILKTMIAKIHQCMWTYVLACRNSSSHHFFCKSDIDLLPFLHLKVQHTLLLKLFMWPKILISFLLVPSISPKLQLNDSFWGMEGRTWPPAASLGLSIVKYVPLALIKSQVQVLIFLTSNLTFFDYDLNYTSWVLWKSLLSTENILSCNFTE